MEKVTQRQGKVKRRGVREKSPAYKPVARGGLTRTEAKAVAELRARLHEVLRPEQIYSVTLFGSKARGDARRGSDVDLLIVHDQVTEQQRERLDTLVWQLGFGINIRPRLEIAMYPKAHVEYLESIGTPLIQNIARDGITLEGEPIMVKQINPRAVAAKKFARAKRALAAARWMRDNGDYAGVVSKAYFVFLDAADAGLVVKGLTPQSHAGTIRFFNLHFVKPGLVPEKFSHLFGKIEQDRLDADYEGEIVWTRDDAGRALERAEEILNLLEQWVQKMLEATA